MHNHTYRYGVMDALEKSLSPAAYDHVSWLDWESDWNTIMDAVPRGETVAVIDGIVSALSPGAQRGTFVRILAHHIRNDTWGNP